MTSINGRLPRHSVNASSTRFEVLDLVRGLAILGMLGSHLVGTEGGATVLERGVTSLLAWIEPTIGALFCVVAGMSWSIQAERVGVSPHFRRYLAGRALALGLFGVVFHVVLWETEILVPFAMMMALSLVVLGAGPRATAFALFFFLAVTPVVERLVAPYTETDWLPNGLHAADGTAGWVTLRYLLVDGNYPLLSWMAFPLMGMLFWQTARGRTRTLAWFFGSLGVAAVAYAIGARMAPSVGADEFRHWVSRGWTPTSAIFLLTAGGGALTVVSVLLWRWGTAAMPRVIRPLVLFGRASLSHYVLHIALAYSVLRLQYPDEDWAPRTGLWAMLAYLTIGIPLTAWWFRHHPHGPLETLWARVSRRPGQAPAGGSWGSSPSVEVIRADGTASLHATHPFAPGEVVVPLEGHPAMHPTRFSIQVGKKAHLAPISERASPWGSMNHSCNPNLAIDVQRRVIVARRPIAAGDELCFDYHTTEWDLNEPFICRCGALDCVGLVRGFAHLPVARQLARLADAAPHIHVLLAARAGRRRARAATGASLGTGTERMTSAQRAPVIQR